MSDIICIFAKSKHRIVRCGDRAFNALLLQETGHFDCKVMSVNACVKVVSYSSLRGSLSYSWRGVFSFSQQSAVQLAKQVMS